MARGTTIIMLSGLKKNVRLLKMKAIFKTARRVCVPWLISMKAMFKNVLVTQKAMDAKGNARKLTFRFQLG